MTENQKRNIRMRSEFHKSLIDADRRDVIKQTMELYDDRLKLKRTIVLLKRKLAKYEKSQ